MRKLNFINCWLAGFFLLIMLGTNTYAQQARETFGKNRIQYKIFNWKFYSSENFDIYFYENGEEIAKEVAGYLENEFDRITETIGYSPYFKTKIFLYNSVADMQQSNVGVSDNTFDVGGQTNFSKSYVEIAHPGTITGLKEELVLRISQLIVNDMMFGGSFSDSWQNSFLLNLPEWFIDGVAYYLAKGWSIEMDDYMRDLMNSGGIKKLNNFSGDDAALVGQSIWNFIVERYGRSNVQNILQLTRITRNEEKSITHTLGINFKEVTYEWQNFYTNMAVEANNGYKSPPNDSWIKTKVKNENRFHQIKLSPDGNKIAFTKNFKGRYSVYVKDLGTGEEVQLNSGGYKVINQQVNYEIPLISWADNNTLGIINIVKGVYTFWLFDINSKSKIPTSLDDFEQVQSFDFNGNGRLAVLSADRDGKNDLYLMSVRRGRLRQLTSDYFDDLDPSFIPGTNTIVFSSNRTTDTLSVDVSDIEELSSTNFNLHYFNLDTTTTVMTRVTNTISRDVYPNALNEYEIFYLSDQKGITNIFKYNLVDSLYLQVTNYSASLKSYDINFEHKKLAAIVLDEMEDRIIVIDNFDLDQNIFTPLTRRQQVNQAKFLSERRNLREQGERTEIPLLLNFQRDTVAQEAEKPDEIIEDQEEELPEDIIDTDNYVFDKEIVEKSSQNNSFLSQYRRQITKSQLIGPLPYETRFSANNLITSMVIDPLRGFGILLETQLNDLLENHRFYGGLMATTDLRSGDIFAEYQYLKNLVDYSGRYSREVIYWNTENALQRYTKNVFEAGASLPLTVKSRATFKPFYMITRYENLDPTLLVPGPPDPDNVTESYIGFKSEFILDNTVISGMNIIEGTRGKLEFTHNENVSNRGLSFSNISLDIRNYQKIHREMVFATRLFYGRFFGQNAQSYLLGGMDNWFFNKSDNEGKDNPLNVSGSSDNSHLLFVEYVTSLRGFDYSSLYGENVLLFNAEFRFPAIRYFYRGPISSNFFKNLQLVGFFDIGSAWTGISPFLRANSVNTIVIKENGSPFQAEIQNFKNPWLSSYGAGLRTVILGYYMKFDLAWPIEDYDIGKPKFHVTLGYDF